LIRQQRLSIAAAAADYDDEYKTGRPDVKFENKTWKKVTEFSYKLMSVSYHTERGRQFFYNQEFEQT